MIAVRFRLRAIDSPGALKNLGFQATVKTPFVTSVARTGDDPFSSKYISETIMKMPRITIRRLMMMVAAFALILGILIALQCRRDRFRHFSAESASAQGRLYRLE